MAQRLSVSLTQIKKWGVQWAWVKRVEDWQDHQDLLKRIEEAEKIKATRDKHAKLAVGMQQAGAERLKLLVGNPHQIRDITLQDMRYLIAEGIRLEREALGEPSQIIQTQRNGQTTVELDNSVAQKLLSDPDACKLATELLGRLAAGEDDASGPGETGVE